MPEQRIEHYHRPSPAVAAEVLAIVRALTGHWFTANVPEDTARDLLFHDVLCLYLHDRMVSMLIFTCLDGAINITLMGTHPDFHGRGYGSQLIEYLCSCVKNMGFDRIVVFTVPPEVNAAYHATVRFYESQGFILRKRYTELWENGAIELVKGLG